MKSVTGDEKQYQDYSDIKINPSLWKRESKILQYLKYM